MLIWVWAYKIGYIVILLHTENATPNSSQQAHSLVSFTIDNMTKHVLYFLKVPPTNIY